MIASSITRTVAAALLLLLVAPADLQAKKKKKKKAEEVGVISGVVMNQTDEILAGVAVSVGLAAAGFSAEAVTDKNGEFRIEVPAEGEYQLKLVKEGYATFENLVFMALGEEQAVQIKLLDAAAGRRSEAVKAYNAGAEAYQAKDLAAAREHFLAATVADPSLAEPYLILSDIYIVEKSYAEAVVAAEKFLELKPGDQKGQMLAYEAYSKLGNQAKVDELIAVLGKTDVAPKLAIEVYNAGAVADQQGDTETAIAKFSGALDLNPEMVEAHEGLATVYYRVGRLDDALASIEKLLAAKPDHERGHRLQFLIQDGRGDRSASDAAMAAYVGVDPKGASDLLYKRADLDFRGGEVDRARGAFHKVLELNPEMARAHYALGKIYASTDTSKAKEHLQKFIAMAPDDPEVASAKSMLSYF